MANTATMKPRMFRCDECGKVFPYSDIQYVEEYRGEYWGMPCHETVAYSPCCMWNFEEITENEKEVI